MSNVLRDAAGLFGGSRQSAPASVYVPPPAPTIIQAPAAVAPPPPSPPPPPAPIPPPEPIKPATPATMPDPENPAAIEAARRAQAEARARQGRTSTILTAGNTTGKRLGAGYGRRTETL